MWAPEGTAERGAALVLAVGASAALAVLAAWILLLAMTEYEAATYRVELRQARVLAGATIRQAASAAAAGVLPLPEGRTVILVNGRAAGSGAAVAVASIPSAPANVRWPTRTAGPDASGRRGSGGVGARLEIHAVRGPAGDLRGGCIACAGERLFRLRATAWFRRARAARAALLLMRDDGAVRLLDRAR